MYRSTSWTRASDELSAHTSPQAGSAGLMRASSTSLDGNEQLPIYDPIFEMTKKAEKPRTKFSENAVHVIPFVLLLCGFILWFFSNPDIDVGLKGEASAARVEGLIINEGDTDTDTDGTQTGLLPADIGDMDTIKQYHKPFEKSAVNRFRA